MFKAVFSLLCLLLLYFTPLDSAELSSPSLMLASRYSSSVDLSIYWVSEKYDGVRAYWNGRQLISRQGNIYHAPQWFIEHFPSTPLDGELWLGRNYFDKLSGIVRRKKPDDKAWKEIKFMVFDLPASTEIFDLRLQQLSTLIHEANLHWLKFVPQYRVKNEKSLLLQLEKIVAEGGEGLMLHKGTSYYRGFRSNDLIKLKPLQNDEATVISILPGKGKYKGMMGSLLLELANGKHFRIGTGFTDLERKNPPAVGDSITFQFSGLTSSGLPRFARFVRIRQWY